MSASLVHRFRLLVRHQRFEWHIRQLHDVQRDIERRLSLAIRYLRNVGRGDAERDRKVFLRRAGLLEEIEKVPIGAFAFSCHDRDNTNYVLACQSVT